MQVQDATLKLHNVIGHTSRVSPVTTCTELVTERSSSTFRSSVNSFCKGKDTYVLKKMIQGMFVITHFILETRQNNFQEKTGKCS